MKMFWYYAVQLYVRIGLFFFFQKVIVKGLENIPANSAVIFAANHQNAFLDAILIACTSKRYTHFLVRADMFKKRWTSFILDSLNMMPVYRIRDGWQSLGRNQKTFNDCARVFAKNGAVVIFPEGNHGGERRVRALSKGFTRLAWEPIEKNGQQIFIVPVGINYRNAQGFGEAVSIFYGPPILANDYLNDIDPLSATLLKDELRARMKLLTTHIETIDNYALIIKKLNETRTDYLNPVETNARIQQIEQKQSLPVPVKKERKINSLQYPIYLATLFVHAIPIAIWKLQIKKIKDPVFIGSLKFVYGIFFIPLFYCAIAVVVLYWTNRMSALGVLLVLSFSSVMLKPAYKP